MQQFMRLTDCRTNVASPIRVVRTKNWAIYKKYLLSPGLWAAMSRTARPVTVPGDVRAAATRRPASSGEDRGQEASVRGHTESKEVRT